MLIPASGNIFVTCKLFLPNSPGDAHASPGFVLRGPVDLASCTLGAVAPGLLILQLVAR